MGVKRHFYYVLGIICRSLLGVILVALMLGIIWGSLFGAILVALINYVSGTKTSEYSEYLEKHPKPWKAVKTKDFCAFVGEMATVKTATDDIGRKLDKEINCLIRLQYAGYDRAENAMLFITVSQRDGGSVFYNFPPMEAKLPHRNPPHGDAYLGRFGEICVISASDEELIYKE